MRPTDDGMVTEPVGRLGVRLVGFRNPAGFAQRTVINRTEGVGALVGHALHLRLPKGLEDYVAGKVVPGRGGKPKEVFDDPYLEISPKLVVPYVTTDGRNKDFPFQKSTLFTATTKMSAASWSIPAGPPAVAGTCAAAELFKNKATYEKALVQGDVEQRTADPKTWICAFCYAGKSNYMYRNSQYAQLAHAVWMRGLIVAHGIEAAANTMAGALAAHLGNKKKREAVGENPLFFRIHDSGDFQLSPNTYLFWRGIALDSRMRNVSFWAPTRMWVFPKFVEMVRQNPPPDNLALRPSALHFNDHAPAIDGFNAGSTAHAKMDAVKAGLAEWSCPAYDHDEKSCAGGGGPKGEKDCRFCWNYKGNTVTYKAH